MQNPLEMPLYDLATITRTTTNVIEAIDFLGADDMTLSCVWGGGGWDERGREQKVSKRNVFEMCVCVREREREIK